MFICCALYGCGVSIKLSVYECEGAIIDILEVPLYRNLMRSKRHSVCPEHPLLYVSLLSFCIIFQLNTTWSNRKEWWTKTHLLATWDIIAFCENQKGCMHHVWLVSTHHVKINTQKGMHTVYQLWIIFSYVYKYLAE